MPNGAVGPVLAAAVAIPALGGAQVRYVAEMNTEQIRELDRAKTAVILPAGILEQHGPYLPSYADGYYNERVAHDLAETIVARPGWSALVFPPIPLGAGGANEIGRKYAFPGSFTVRPSTLRAVFMDLGDELGELGFRWIFVVHGHGDPAHNHALDEAGRYFHDVHGGRMVHLTGGMDLFGCCKEWQQLTSAEALKEDGVTVHAGLTEQSGVLFLRPDLVPAAVAQAPPITVTAFDGLVQAARKPDWPGYFGSPARATAAIGAGVYREELRVLVAQALKVLDGQDGGAVPRYADTIIADPVVRSVVDDALAHAAAREARQRAWIEKQPPWPPTGQGR